MSTERSPIRKALRLVLWVCAIGCVATPLVGLAMVYGKVFGGYLSATRDFGPRPLQINMGDALQDEPRIATGVIAEECATGRPASDGQTISTLDNSELVRLCGRGTAR